jgi:hypothetical protein
MKKMFIILLMLAIAGISNFCFSKPYKPQVMGGFSSVEVFEYRYKGGKINQKPEDEYYTILLDDKGNPIEMNFYEKNKITARNKIQNKYNDKGLIIETTMFDVNGNAIEKHSFAYDDATNMVRDTIYDDKGSVRTIGHHIHDKDNFIVQEIYEVKIDSNEFSKGVTYIRNDRYGNPIEESANRSSTISAEISSETNLGTGETKGESKVEETPTQNLDKITYEYKYDAKGNIIRQVRTSFDGYKLINEYKYDEYGNMTEQISLDDKGKPGLKRVFKYKK